MLNRALKLTLLLAVFALVFGFALVPVQVAFAQDAPVADTPTSEPPTPTTTPTNTPTNTPEPTFTATWTPIPTATNTPEPAPPTITPSPVPSGPTPTPVPIPEPVTIALFATGLAALSGVVARRRNKKD